MAWTAPRTWVTGETVTAALMNAHIRDNFLETSAATVTTAGDLAYADAANSMGSRLAIGAAATVLVSDGSAPIWAASGENIGDATYTSASGGGSGSPTAFKDFDDVDWGTGTTVSVTLTTRTVVLLWYGMRSVSADTAGTQVEVAYRISGATTTAATVQRGTRAESSAVNDQNTLSRANRRAALTAGSNTFTLQGNSNDEAAVITANYPWLIVMAI